MLVYLYVEKLKTELELFLGVVIIIHNSYEVKCEQENKQTNVM